ncbi:MAG: hypothetical protein PHZ24_09050 [Bacteroidales bacterium]|nr:hypothetical protein [Bacteroidales bacterium]
MKTEFKQVDGFLTFKATAFDANEKALLKELFQMEIPGYEHAFVCDYDDSSTFEMKYVPIISTNNLLREVAYYGIELSTDMSNYVIAGFNKTLYISHSMSTGNVSQQQYRIIDNATQLITEEGVLSNIYELRPLLKDIMTMGQSSQNLL